MGFKAGWRAVLRGISIFLQTGLFYVNSVKTRECSEARRNARLSGYFFTVRTKSLEGKVLGMN